MFSLNNKKPRCIHRGLLPTGNPQSVNLLERIIGQYRALANTLPPMGDKALALAIGTAKAGILDRVLILEGVLLGRGAIKLLNTNGYVVAPSETFLD